MPKKIPSRSREKKTSRSPSPPEKTFQEWCDERDRVSIEIQGKLTKIKHHVPKQANFHGGKKQEITGFTAKSRLNLMKYLATVNWNAIQTSLFVTLTYPDEKAFQDQEKRNTQRYLFHRNIENHLDHNVPVLWRIEWELRKRGRYLGQPIPHWHMLVFGEHWIDHKYVNETWAKTIGHTGYVRTETVKAYKEDAVGMYIGKYLAKSRINSSLVYATYHNCSGRHWGILRKDEIPLHIPKISQEMDPLQEKHYFEFAEANLNGFHASGRQSFSLIGNLSRLAEIEYEKKKIDEGLTTG